MKRVKNEQTTNTLTSEMRCDDCLELILLGDKMVRVGYAGPSEKGVETPMFWLLVMHPKCAKDLGGDLAVEIAR